MKRISIILISILSLALIHSCEEDQVGPTLSLSDAVAPTITLPANNSSLVLTFPEADSVLIIRWSAADYKMENIPAIKYTLVMEYPSKGMETTLASTDALETKITYQNLNFKLLDIFGLEPEEQGDFVFKVTASLTDNSTTEDLTSTPLNISITTYDAEPPPAKPIYLLGDATQVGWNNNAALEMTHVKDGLFEITATLNSTGDWIKFISQLGKWAPQWGTDDSGTWEAGPLVYRPTESVPDPRGIPAPHVAGDYLIRADTANLVYTVTSVTAKLFICGSATDAGLDYSNALPMVKTGVLTFETSVYLKGGNNYTFGFITSQSESSPQYVLSEKGKLTYVSQGANERLIPGPKEEGWYMVRVDLMKRSYSLIKK